MKNAKDEQFMHRAIELALKGWGNTSPNPIVGAVLVKRGRIVGEGYHRRAGEAHAEVNAIRKAKLETKGATLYVTLEPCCHQGLTPPCIDRIISSGIKRVVIGMQDPNPVVNGRGIRALRNVGIKVTVGVLRDACREINQPYETSVIKGRPFVILKAALSLDGKIATLTGESKWITCEECRGFVHRIRSGVDAIIVGRGTIVADDPLLTTRIDGKSRAGVVVVLDEKMDLPKDSRIFGRKAGELILATAIDAPKDRVKWAKDKGYDVILCPYSSEKRISLHHLLHELNKRRIMSILIEGGGETYGDFVKNRLADHVVLCIAPKIIGGEGINAFPNQDIRNMNDVIRLKEMTFRKLGDDFVIEGRLE